MADRVRLLAAAALLGALSACAPMYGPPPPGRSAAMPPADDSVFRAGDFAWSQAPGRNTLAGSLGHAGPVRYTCAGATVVMTPETPWATRRMMVLYKSTQRAALPADDVRSRQNQAPPGDSNPYVKRATCDAADHFSFINLPDGAWYLVTIAKPAAGASGPTLAIMRRVTTRGGKITTFEL
jgi:hypothetical protein